MYILFNFRDIEKQINNLLWVMTLASHYTIHRHFYRLQGFVYNYIHSLIYFDERFCAYQLRRVKMSTSGAFQDGQGLV